MRCTIGAIAALSLVVLLLANAPRSVKAADFSIEILENGHTYDPSEPQCLYTSEELARLFAGEELSGQRPALSRRARRVRSRLARRMSSRTRRVAIIRAREAA